MICNPGRITTVNIRLKLQRVLRDFSYVWVLFGRACQTLHLGEVPACLQLTLMLQS